MAFCLLILCLLCSPGLAAARGPMHMNWMSHAQMMAPGRRAERPVLIYFSAPWCYLCRKMQRLVFPDPKVSAMMSQDFDLVRVDISEEKKIAKAYNIKQVPTTIFMDAKGRPILRHTGYLDRKRLTLAMRFVTSGAYRTQDWDSYRSSH